MTLGSLIITYKAQVLIHANVVAQLVQIAILIISIGIDNRFSSDRKELLTEHRHAAMGEQFENVNHLL